MYLGCYTCDHKTRARVLIIFFKYFRYTNLKEAGEAASITIANAEPIDSIIDGAGALAPNCKQTADNLYSVPTVSETDNALTEYTFVKEVKIEKPAEPEVYSSASTLSLGETVILSDGWINRSNASSSSSSTSHESRVTSPQGTREEQLQDSSESDFVLTLDVDTSASVI